MGLAADGPRADEAHLIDLAKLNITGHMRGDR